MISKISTIRWLFLGCVVFLSSCKVYKQDIMFRLDDNFTEEDLSEPVKKAEENYLIQVNDYIELNLFTNDGERIIDPNPEIFSGNNNLNNRLNSRQQFEYLVQVDGVVKLPVVDRVNLAGLTVNEAEIVLQNVYNEFYKDCFVKIKVNNRRVVLLGANGGQVILLENENVTLAEVLALYGGLSLGAKANNIKLIRGDLTNPMVYQMDLTTIDGMRSTIIKVEPGDIIYVEPWRRPWLAGLRDVSPILSITSSVIAFFLLIQSITR